MDAVSEVKARLSIEDVVAEYVQLKRAGRNYKGLSPFGNEKTPSFVVSPEKQIWHDFSSGKGGDMFTFIQEVEGLDFKETLELLARKAGVDMEQFKGQTKSNSKQKDRLYEVLDLSAKFYQAQLRGSKTALEYLLKTRAFTKETVLKFRLGYSPNTGDALINFLKSKNYTQEEASAAGLITQRYNGWGDMFRGRVMVPLSDAQGRVVGFTARILEDNPDAPKYINTPSTLLYDKGRQAYGLHLAKEAIRKQKFGVVVEGNLDVIASHQAGIENVVAAAGTALTEAHLKDLGRYAPDIRFAFDSDKAGIAATERAIPLAQKVGVNVSIITIPGGKDPDELVRKDPKLWQDAIEHHQYAVDWLIERYKGLLDIESGQGKRQFTDVVLQIIRGLSDKVEQDHYLGELAKSIGVSKEAMAAKLTEQAKEIRPIRLKKPVASVQTETKETVERRKSEQRLLSLLLMQPKLRVEAQMIRPQMLTSPEAQELLNFLAEHPDFENATKDIQELQSIADYVKITVLQFEELYRNLEYIELHNEVTRLQERLVDMYVKDQKQRVRKAMETASDTDTRKLLEADKRLNDLLKQAKEHA
ncbi:MAG: primase [Candidatus Saccharibacteria bacterium]|nr:primase [Candidatus Saccharibacteria bacterium]